MSGSAGFIRPEARAAIWRWREVLSGMALAILGLWLAAHEGGLVAYVGAFLAGVGVVLIAVGAQRARFRGRTGGPGSVDIDEGQITYFGPLSGGAIALRELDELALIQHGQSPHWRLRAAGEVLHIPIDADGNEGLFDAFAVLPGLRLERMLAALRAEPAHDTVIWTRQPVRPGTGRLH